MNMDMTIGACVRCGATLLSAEKPEKKWPDDFRGFASNVQPKKRRKS